MNAFAQAVPNGSVPLGINIETHADLDSWLAARKRGIGGSDAAALFGVNPFKSEYELWGEKSGLLDGSSAETEAQYWGKELEEPIARRYAKVTGRQLVDHGRYTIFRSTELPFLFCTPDREIVGDARGHGSLSIKNVTAFKATDWEDEPPDYYQIQLQHELHVLGWSWGSFAVLIGGNTFRGMDVERNQRFIDILVEKCAEFWRRVEEQDPPRVDGSQRTRDALHRLHSVETSDIVQLPESMLDVDAELCAVKADQKKLDARRTLLENQIKEAIGAASFGALPGGGGYRWKTVERAGYSVGPKRVRELRRAS